MQLPDIPRLRFIVGLFVIIIFAILIYTQSISTEIGVGVIVAILIALGLYESRVRGML